jgi:Protein of unknown function (DUF3046)
VRYTEFWSRMTNALGPAYVGTWAREQAISGLEGMTVEEAIEAGWAPKEIWREVWHVLELPIKDR